MCGLMEQRGRGFKCSLRRRTSWLHQGSINSNRENVVRTVAVAPTWHAAEAGSWIV